MTCIVGLVSDGRVYIGGDSAGVSAYEICSRVDEKVFRNGPMLFGFAGSFRMGQLLRYALTVPDRDDKQSVMGYMVTTFIDAVRECLKTGGVAKRENDIEEGGLFLVGYEGTLYRVDGDYQVGVVYDDYVSIGSGAEVADGAMFAGKGLRPKARIRQALAAAEHHTPHVRGPFVIRKMRGLGSNPNGG